MKSACILLLMSLMSHPLLPAETLTIESPMAQVFEEGVLARAVQLNQRGAVVLYDLNLIEDDGPGACSVSRWWDQSTQDIIRHNNPVKKVLMVDHPEAMESRLTMSISCQKSETQPLEIHINPKLWPRQKPIQLEPDTPKWEGIPIDSGMLIPGENEIILSCEGTSGWEINIAKRDDIMLNASEGKIAGQRSFKSTDGGKTWSSQLGEDRDQSGEYMVRLNLQQYVECGTLQSPVIDLAAQSHDESFITQAVDVSSLKLITETDVPSGTAIEFDIRTSPMPDVASSKWSDWQPVKEDEPVSGTLDRFIQWRAKLTTDVATQTPMLHKVKIQAKINCLPQSWAEQVTVIDSHNEQIHYTSIPFEYEKFDEVQLSKLREKYKLDDVVAGAKSELEMMIKLRNWVSRQWEFDPPMPPYPAWDAHEILERRSGFCVQYAVVYMQCALSLGVQTRFVFGNFPHTTIDGDFVAGHEVNEFYSNEYGKWIMMDAQKDECFVDRSTGVPLNMLQLHEELVELYYGDEPVDLSGRDFPEERKSPNVQVWKSDEVAPRTDLPVMHLKWGTVRWMPRNNFYAHRHPEPIAQGRVTWSWTGYWQWQDRQTGRQWRFPRYTTRRSDVEWTLNQVQFAAAYGDQAGEIEIKMASVTPDFDTLLVKIDDGEWKPTGDTFDWRLNQGSNRLEMRSRNRAGVLGRPSWMELNYGD